nr:unnamed protein product [Digitaria exilis]
MLLQPHPNPLAPLRASSSSSLAARLRLPFPSLLSRSTRRKWPPLLRLLCLAPPAICSVVCAARLVFSPSSVSASAGPPPLGGGKLLVLQYLLLVGAVAIGSLIRRRQSGWLRPAGGAAEGLGVGLVERVDKVEDSVRGMVAAVGVLSRIVEKLGVRFRVLRRTLRDSISETATLAQKNSEATRILAAQEHLLEKEIGAIQKVLCAMQGSATLPSVVPSLPSPLPYPPLSHPSSRRRRDEPRAAAQVSSGSCSGGSWCSYDGAEDCLRLGLTPASPALATVPRARRSAWPWVPTGATEADAGGADAGSCGSAAGSRRG